jgi:hypothetical protein
LYVTHAQQHLCNIQISDGNAVVEHCILWRRFVTSKLVKAAAEIFAVAKAV